MNLLTKIKPQSGDLFIETDIHSQMKLRQERPVKFMNASKLASVKAGASSRFPKAENG